VPAKFPTIEDFAHREIIKTDEKTSMVYVNPFGYDIWTYVGIGSRVRFRPRAK
jgi:hypothetical protein